MSSRTEARRKSDPLDTIAAVPASRRVSLGPDSPLVDILGTTNQIIVTLSGKFIILSTPQNINTGADVIFNSVTLSAATANRLLATNGAKKGVSVANLGDWIAGVTGRALVANVSGGKVTITASKVTQSATEPSNPILSDIWLRTQ